MTKGQLASIRASGSSSAAIAWHSSSASPEVVKLTRQAFSSAVPLQASQRLARLISASGLAVMKLCAFIGREPAERR